MNVSRRAMFAQLALAGLVDVLLGREAAAADVTYTYDDLGRLTSATYADGSKVTYTYDAAGNRLTLSSQGPTGPTGTFSASPGAINQGASSTLSWTSSNATSASIDNGVGPVTPAAGGSVSVSPSSTTSYTLTLTGPGGSATKQATVAVNGPPSATFWANPLSIVQGSSATLNWTSSNATSVTINNGVGAVSPAAGGSVSVSPSTTTTYTATITGPGGTITRTATVTIIPPPTGTLSASPSTINLGSSATLSWTSGNATSVTIDNGVGSVSPVAGGSVSVSPSTNTTYTATIVGPAGTITRTATVAIDTGFTQTIPVSGPAPVNLRNLADAAGYNGAENATIAFEVNGGVVINGATGSPNGGVAIDTGTWPTGSYAINLTLRVKNTGIVRGGGGKGGRGAAGTGSLAAAAGGAGGDAVYCRVPLQVVVETGGSIRAGGGGGGGGGYGFGTAGTNHGGGGGGGGFPNGSGGAGGSATGVQAGSSGTSGTSIGGGSGGAKGGSTAGNGGNGGVSGSWGSAGQNGNASNGASSGAAGYAIRKNGHTVNVTNNGTITGTVG